MRQKVVKPFINVSLLIYLKDKYMSLGLVRPRNHLEVKLAYSKQINAQMGHSGNLSLYYLSPQRSWKHHVPTRSMRPIRTLPGLTISLWGDFPVKYSYCRFSGQEGLRAGGRGG